MTTFDDFDAWGEAIRGANLQLACDSLEIPRWTLDVRRIGALVLQAAEEGGGNLCYGVNSHPGALLFLPLTRVESHVVNGEQLDDDTLFVIPPHSDFCIHVKRRAHAWASIALPAACTGHTLGCARSHVVRPPHGAVERLRRLIQRMIASPVLASGATAERQLASAADACLARGEAPATRPGRPRVDRGEIVRRSLAALEADPLAHPSIESLSLHAGITQRTLRRAFHDTFGLGPLAYMKLRLLHRVRRALRDAEPGTTVSQVLVAHGIWDFGRFAGRYRRQFGESLVATLRR